MRQLKYHAFVLTMLLLPGLACADWFRDEAAIMGTAVNVELWHDDEHQGRSLIDAAMDEMRRIDQLMSSYKAESELSRVNAESATQAVIVSTELFALIEQALRYSDITDGAFDITYASAGQYYDYRTGRKPDDQQLAAALPAISYRHVILDKTHSSVRFTQPGVRIDLGGIAKGYAVDRCIAMLQAAGISNALVTAGGDTRVIGRRWKHPWMIGVRDPRKHDGIITRIPLEDAAISTSGDYERFFDQDGIRYHHILNPGTGDSPREVHSTTIIGTNATHTDALSTSVFVLGVTKGLSLINTLPDTEAVIIDNQGKMHYSDGLEQLTH
ncbi:MAG: FAD:protein FMN transferase [Gammaproteobacteria bacterium]